MDNEIVLSGYQLFRLDRNGHGGGIAVYVHDSLLCKVVLQGGPFYLELISISFHSKPSFCLTLFYHPPSSPVSIFDNLCTTLQIINPAQFCVGTITFPNLHQLYYRTPFFRTVQAVTLC